MALLLLIAIGAIIGWLSTIVTRTEDARGILTGVGTGAAASTIAGLFSNKGSVIGGLNLVALLIAVVAAVAALAALHYYKRHQADA